jgi:2'-5' RNA ligase
MPRLFTGIELPEVIAGRLSMLRAGLSGANWIDQSNYHITLRFAGDISGHDASCFADALCEVSFQSFDLQLAGLGAFGGNKPRSVVARIKPSEPLERLQRAHERAARLAGLPPETRNFTPHVTLARLRGTRPQALADYLASHGGLFSGPFHVSRFVLFSSRPNHGGGPYVIEESFPSRDHDGDDEAAA